MNDATADDEAAILQALRRAMVAVHQKSGTIHRSQHPKAHGVVRAVFEVCDVPEEYRFGVFFQKQAFDCWIRFSNGRERTDDRKPDVHGMAIKLLDVPGPKVTPAETTATTQDFVLADSPTFFAEDAKRFLQFLSLKGEQEQLRKQAAESLPSADLEAFDRKQLGQLVTDFPAIQGFFTTIASPLAVGYHSQTPYQFGNRIVKYFARPASSNLPTIAGADSPSILREAMRTVLTEERREARFEFGIEVQTDPSRMPLEEATRPWNSTVIVALATITIPAQDFLTDVALRFGESLAFSPWHALVDHRPLGSLNAARREAYEDSLKTRHEATAMPCDEPELSRLNRETLAHFFDSFAKSDVAAMQSCLHPDVTFSDIGFDLCGDGVGTMWEMIVKDGIKVQVHELSVTGQTGFARWRCDYDFRPNKDSAAHHVTNEVQSEFQFAGGLIREQRDSCDFWKWFEQAMGPAVGSLAHFLSGIEIAVERLLRHDVPIDVEKKIRDRVKTSAKKLIEDFLARKKTRPDPPSE